MVDYHDNYCSPLGEISERGHSPGDKLRHAKLCCVVADDDEKVAMGGGDEFMVVRGRGEWKDSEERYR